MASGYRRLTAAFAVLLLGFGSVSNPAEAAPLPQCGFKTDIALMCLVGETAADIYQALGVDIEKIKEPFSQRIIHESGCIVVYNALRFQKGIQRMQSVRIPEPDGTTVRALFIDVLFGAQHYDMWVAENYLTGTCPRFVYSGPAPTDTNEIICDDKIAQELVRRSAQHPDSISNHDYSVALDVGKCRLTRAPR